MDNLHHFAVNLYISKELDSIPKDLIFEPNLTAQLNWHRALGIPKVVGSIPAVVRHIFQLFRCGD